MSTNCLFKDDTVYYLKHESSLAFIGSVVKSNNIVPDEMDVDDYNTETKSSDPIAVATSEQSVSRPGNYVASTDHSCVDVDWMSLATGHVYSTQDAPVPSKLKPDDVFLLERDHLLGDAVRHRTKDCVGTVVNMHIQATAELLSYSCVLFNLECSRLRSVVPWTSRVNENHVIWRGWLGRVVGCRMLAIVRFVDGARLLVHEESLHSFEPVSPTSDAFPDPCFEGAWIRGDASEFKINPDSKNLSALGHLLGNSSARSWSSGHLFRRKHANATTHSSASSEHTMSSGASSVEVPPSHPEIALECSAELPPGHPLHLIRELERSPATKSWSHGKDQINKILEHTPLFLNETKLRNSKWLCRLRPCSTVSVFVERFLPVEATVHWFVNRGASNTRPPPSVVRGEDLCNIRSVVPYPYLGCTERDIWYVQLQESDNLYKINAHDCLERLLYHWLVGDRESLDAARVPFDRSPSNTILQPTVPQSEQANLIPPECTSDTTSKDSSSVSTVDEDHVTGDWTKTTPFWAQKTLLYPGHRSGRVICNPKKRVTYSDAVSWVDEKHDYDVYLSDEESDEDTTLKSKDKAKSGCGSSGEQSKSAVVGRSKKGKTEFREKKADLSGSSSGEQQVQQQTNQATSDEHTFSSSVANLRSSSNQFLDSSKEGNQASKVLTAQREKHLLPLRAGTWVAVGLHTTQTKYDVRWQDGSLETDIDCADLLPIYFNIDEHEFFPGTLVSLKNPKRATSSSKLGATSNLSGDKAASADDIGLHDLTRDYGIVLSANPKDRVCLIQWFRAEDKGETSIKQLIPLGDPEEAGVYELSASSDRRLNYGDVPLMAAGGDPSHPDFPAGYVVDILPSTGKVLIHWVDGTKSEVLRNECLFPLSTFVDDDDWSNDDSDEYDSDELTSDWDSEWETVSETSSEDEDKPSKKDTDTQPVTRAEVGQADSPYKESVRQAASLVLQAYNHTEAARQLFSDRRTFVFWVLRRFVAVPDELDTVVDQLGTLLAAAAVSPDYTIPVFGDTSSQLPQQSTVCPNTPNAVASQSSSQCLSPAKPWSHEEESEAIAVTDKLQLTRTVIQQAYHLCHDYRLKKLYTKCDHRELFSQKYVEGILKSIEIDANLDLSHGPSGAGSQQSAEDNHMAGDTKDDSVFEHSMHKSSSSHLDIANFCSIVRNQYVLDPEILVALRLSLMKVLIVPDSMHPFTSTDENWRGRIHYCTIQSDSGVDEAHPAYMLVSSSLFAQLTRYLNVVHNRLLEQLSEFGTQASAWLGEMAPDLLSPADKSAHDESAEFDQCPLVSAPASIEQELSNDKHPDDKALMRRDSRRESRAMITVDSIPDEYRGEFIVDDTAPSTHRFFRYTLDNPPKTFMKAWKRDTALLSTSLPRGIIVKAFADRMDLYSLLIVGPAGTPYEHGLFLFDIHLLPKYPSVPPKVHYYSFASERVNPNLYVEGHVCLSLLGTWSGKGLENWNAESSNLLQLVVSLQGLILNSEPYFNEAGFELCRGAEGTSERSRVYNESVVATLVQSMVSLLANPVPVFETQIVQHCKLFGEAYVSLLNFWATLDESEYERRISCGDSHPPQSIKLPEFPLAPVSKGFQISVRRHSEEFLRLVVALTQSDG